MKIRWFVFKKYLSMMMDPRWCNGVPSTVAGGLGLGFLALLRSRPRPLSPRSSSSSSCHRRQWKLTATNPLARHPASPPPPRPPLILVNQSRQVARSLFRNITSAILERNLSSWLCPVSSSILRPLSLLSATTTKSILHSRSSSSPASPRFTSLTFSSTNLQTPRRNQTPSPSPSRSQPNGFELSRVRIAVNPNPNISGSGWAKVSLSTVLIRVRQGGFGLNPTQVAPLLFPSFSFFFSTDAPLPFLLPASSPTLPLTPSSFFFSTDALPSFLLFGTILHSAPRPLLFLLRHRRPLLLLTSCGPDLFSSPFPAAPLSFPLRGAPTPEKEEEGVGDGMRNGAGRGKERGEEHRCRGRERRAKEGGDAKDSLKIYVG